MGHGSEFAAIKRLTGNDSDLSHLFQDVLVQSGGRIVHQQFGQQIEFASQQLTDQVAGRSSHPGTAHSVHDWKNLLRVSSFHHALFEFLDVFGRQLRAIHLDRQLVQLGGQRERRLIVGVVHPGERVGANVEALVSLIGSSAAFSPSSWWRPPCRPP